MQDIMETHVLSMCMALHSNSPPLQQWAKGQGVPLARHLAAHARIDLRPRQRVSWQVNAQECVEAAMLQCLQGNELVADDGDILPIVGGPGTLVTSTAPSAKGSKPHKVDVVTLVAPHGNPDTHACNHDLITFRRGMQCATCKEVVRVWCNTCLVCHACFSVGPHPCTALVVNVVDDVCEEGEINSASELATPHKPNKRHGVARMHAKLVMAAQSGKLREWTRAVLSRCLDALGVTVPVGSKRRQTSHTLCGCPSHP